MTNVANVHDPVTVSDVGTFASWTLNRARQGEPVAVAFRPKQKKLCVATRDEAWVIDLKKPESALFLGVLETHCVSQNSLQIWARNLPVDLTNLSRLMAQRLERPLREVFDGLSRCFVGDLTAAGHCVNLPVTPSVKYRRIEHDAFEVALNLPQYTHMIARYYEAIGIPLGKAMTEGALFGGKGAYDWWVTYHHLWVRVFASVTADPTLIMAFADDRDPFECVADATGLSNSDAEIGLLYQACGRDMSVLRRRFPDRVSDLPGDVERLSRAFDLGMPALVNSCAAAIRAYHDQRAVTTLYGRRLRPGNHMGEAIAFPVFGAVEEILAVAGVAFIQNRPSSEILLAGFEGGMSGKVIRIAGVGKKGLDSWENLRELAGLAEPLSPVLLLPQIVCV